MSLTDALLLDPAPFNVWIAARTDGIKGCGTTPDDPFDGSTQARFDAVMQVISAQFPAKKVAIHLGPGTFETRGYPNTGGWKMKAGMRILGSGIDVTTLKLVSPATGQNYAIGHDLGASTRADLSEVMDLTIDCNLPTTGSGPVCNAIRLMGDHALIRRVRAMNWGSRDSTKSCFVLSCITALPDSGVPEIAHAGIDACVVNTPGANLGFCTALYAGNPDDVSFVAEGHGKSPYIRDCFVDCGVGQPDPANGKYRGLSMSWCRGGVVEGNHVYNTDIGGPYQDAKRNARDVIVRNNFFKNVGRGPQWSLGVLGLELGEGSMTRSGTVGTVFGVSLTGLAVGVRVKLATSPPDYSGVYVIRSLQASPAQFTVDLPASGPLAIQVPSAMKVFGVSRAIIEGNVIELPPGVSGASAALVDDANGTNPYPEAPDFVHGDIIFRNNKIRYVDGTPPNDKGALLIDLKGSKSIFVQNNVLDTIAAAPLQNRRCGNSTYFNNRRPSGTLHEGVNADTGLKYCELETDADFALVMSMFTRRVG